MSNLHRSLIGRIVWLPSKRIIPFSTPLRQNRDTCCTGISILHHIGGKFVSVNTDLLSHLIQNADICLMKREIINSDAAIGPFSMVSLIDLATSRFAKSKLLVHPFSKSRNYFLFRERRSQSRLTIGQTLIEPSV